MNWGGWLEIEIVGGGEWMLRALGAEHTHTCMIELMHFLVNFPRVTRNFHGLNDIVL